jgi:hypothetical protein
MTALFADTFYWIALADSTDGAHQRALAFTVEWAMLKDELSDIEAGRLVRFRPPLHF